MRVFYSKRPGQMNRKKNSHCFLFCHFVPTLENGEELCIRVFFFSFFLFLRNWRVLVQLSPCRAVDGVSSLIFLLLPIRRSKTANDSTSKLKQESYNGILSDDSSFASKIFNSNFCRNIGR